MPKPGTSGTFIAEDKCIFLQGIYERFAGSSANTIRETLDSLLSSVPRCPTMHLGAVGVASSFASTRRCIALLVKCLGTWSWIILTSIRRVRDANLRILVPTLAHGRTTKDGNGVKEIRSRPNPQGRVALEVLEARRIHSLRSSRRSSHWLQ